MTGSIDIARIKGTAVYGIFRCGYLLDAIETPEIDATAKLAYKIASSIARRDRTTVSFFRHADYYALASGEWTLTGKLED